MSEKQDFHIKADKKISLKARELSGLSNRELYELGCKVAIEENRNILDAEILELNEIMERADELYDSIRMRLKEKEVPTEPGDNLNMDEKELKRNILPLDLFKEMVFYYMDDFDIDNIEDLNSKNKDIFRFVLINSAHYEMSVDEINELYNSR